MSHARLCREDPMMGPLALRSALRRSRRSVAVLAVLFVITASIVVHHSMPMSMHGMSGMPSGSVCLAIALGAVAVAGSGLAVGPVRFPQFSFLGRLRLLTATVLRSVPARAGPFELQVLRL